MRNRRVVIRGTSDPKLTPLQEAIESDVRTDPEMATELRAHSIGTRDEARKTRGSQDGNAGPRMMMLAGYETPGDGGEGVFYWDSTSTTADDEGVATLAPLNGGVGRWKRAQLYPDPIPQSAALVGVRVLTAGTSYTKTAGTRDVVIEMWGGGGAGGGVPAAGAGLTSVGAGGGSGGYLRKRIAGIAAGALTIAIGAAGAGASNAVGGNGGNTTFNDGTTTYTAFGGTGGQPGPAATAAVSVVQGGDGGAVSTNGDANGAGAPGMFGLVVGATSGVSGNGGSTSLGGAGRMRTTSAATSIAGLAAVANTGSGGSGASSNNAAANSGGNGAAGLIIVTEFS